MLLPNSIKFSGACGWISFYMFMILLSSITMSVPVTLIPVHNSIEFPYSNGFLFFNIYGYFPLIHFFFVAVVFTNIPSPECADMFRNPLCIKKRYFNRRYTFKKFPRIVILLYFRKKLTKLLKILMGIIIPFQVQKSAAIIT